MTETPVDRERLVEACRLLRLPKCSDYCQREPAECMKGGCLITKEQHAFADELEKWMKP